MTKRVQANGAKIELMVNVVEVVSEQERKYKNRIQLRKQGLKLRYWSLISLRIASLIIPQYF